MRLGYQIIPNLTESGRNLNSFRVASLYPNTMCKPNIPNFGRETKAVASKILNDNGKNFFHGSEKLQMSLEVRLVLMIPPLPNLNGLSTLKSQFPEVK